MDVWLPVHSLVHSRKKLSITIYTEAAAAGT